MPRTRGERRREAEALQATPRHHSAGWAKLKKGAIRHRFNKQHSRTSIRLIKNRRYKLKKSTKKDCSKVNLYTKSKHLKNSPDSNDIKAPFCGQKGKNGLAYYKKNGNCRKELSCWRGKHHRLYVDPSFKVRRKASGRISVYKPKSG
mmetsp:Transcript_20289/g.51915  ORF Transcript_20289/g.51915 Transcript_20289/m.51915 type:complete len:147 (+) Transcript_20289:3665-4105(+)